MTYIAAGNLAAKTKFDGKVVSYGYDELNRQTLRDFQPALGAADELDETATYDLSGQRLAATDSYGTRRFAYDARGRLARVDHPTGEAISYKYDELEFGDVWNSGTFTMFPIRLGICRRK